ncbi:DDT domain-containing protein DDR4-like [Gossypium australe]|uniref:DDT domain-containing protein DDR4-like n=1 Tax=Gossypium australe TaxID=47621 RepID=A0A5B6XAR3_9ROSI|nr:DDT domain-containing protein DDR4-like [Gossypium australe]
MVVDRRKPSLGPMPSVEGKETRDDSVLILDDSSFNSEVAKLRNRWELASVLNFLIVFEPLIGTDLKLTAEEIELGLVKPNTSIAALHVKLLKGTPPMSKLLNVSDGWVTVLCKKLAVWWPWVAEGEIPLTARNGEEISKYKELDPTSRLLLLKALCEIRADQDDAVSYINDAMRSNKEISCFRKEKIGANGNVSYWYDGNTVFGYRLYKEINRTESKSKAKRKASSTLPTVCSHWETLAVDFKEFREVVDKLLASRTAAEVAIGKTINNDVIPVVDKFQKKKERALKRKERQEILLNDLRNSSGIEITRSCRNRRPVSYTFGMMETSFLQLLQSDDPFSYKPVKIALSLFGHAFYKDEYDRAIDEAIELTKKRKTVEEQSHGQKLPRQCFALNGGSDVEGSASKGSSDGKTNSSGSDTEDDKLHEAGDDGNEKDDDDNDDYSSGTDGDDSNGSDSGNSADENENLNDEDHKKDVLMGSCQSKRLAGGAIHPGIRTGNLGTKSRLRQRPMVNSALEIIVSDSEDDIPSDHTT